MLDFLIYCGKQIEGNTDLSATERIVDTLIQPFLVLSKFIDNYYTSPFLVDYLLKRDMYTVGTVQTKQKNFPEELAEHRIEKGKALFYADKFCNILACKFRWKKDKANGKPMIIHMLSSKHTYGIESSGGKDRDNSDIIKLTVILNYNQKMGGVDVTDQQLHGIQTTRKSYKWSTKVTIRIIMLCTLNCTKWMLIHQRLMRNI
ncbi:uncharacterized protein LOC117114968 [Anneissia japonica]|uniref:uncharacterized protein LOC117114968 n=1 Tax=Anneissia japonica TaxID=1529436 RepID=UPI001425B99E|nr:uncharacterized protein LOC117114968 [Anneissia japonica]